MIITSSNEMWNDDVDPSGHRYNPFYYQEITINNFGEIRSTTEYFKFNHGKTYDQIRDFILHEINFDKEHYKYIKVRVRLSFFTESPEWTKLENLLNKIVNLKKLNKKD